MEISEVKVKLVSNKDNRLKAFCSVTFDREFVVHDIKVIEGGGGHFVAMPSRKLSDHCEKCKGKNHLKAKYCNNCGANLRRNRIEKNSKGKVKLHADIAHPVQADCRIRIQDKVIEAFKKELEESQKPGYQPVDMTEKEDEIPDIIS
jgi:stage V sporulation protein G